jgi:site-specific recombinase XerD
MQGYANDDAYPAARLRHHARAWGPNLVLVTGLLGHAQLETTRGYTRPTAANRVKALDLLPVDR